MFLSILSRTISIEGCLFLMYLLGLYIVFNIPLENTLRKLFKRHKKISEIIQILLMLITARVLAWKTEPFVSKAVDRLVELTINWLSNF